MLTSNTINTLLFSLLIIPLLRITSIALTTQTLSQFHTSFDLSQFTYPPHPNSKQSIDLKHGTTTLGFKFAYLDADTAALKQAIILAVDSRSTMGSTISSSSVLKVIPISKHILGTMAGGAGDCSVLLRCLRVFNDRFRGCCGNGESGAGYGIDGLVNNNQDGIGVDNTANLRHHHTRDRSSAGKDLPIQQLASTLSNALYERRSGDKSKALSVGTMICGFDRSSTSKPLIYYIDSQGNIEEGNVFAVGSGGEYALGVLDHAIRSTNSNTENKRGTPQFNSTNDAIVLGIKAISIAGKRDGYSGGVCNVFIIEDVDSDSDDGHGGGGGGRGWRKVWSSDLGV